MAARTLYPKQGGTQFYSVAEWSLADDDAQNQSKPVAGDTIILTANSAQVLCNEAWAAASLSHPGAGTSEWYFGAQIAVVSGDITLDKVIATVEDADITATNLDVGTNGSLTFSGPFATITADMELDGGTIDDGGYDIEVIGSFIRASGTLTSTGEWTFSGTGNLKNDASAAPFNEIVISGTMTNAGTVYTKKTTITGTLNGTTNRMTIISASAGWWGAQTGTVNCDVQSLSNSTAPGNAITLNNRALNFTSSTTDSITMDAAINIGTGRLSVLGMGAGDSMTLDMNGHALICGDVVLGSGGPITANGILDFGGGIISIASVTDGNAANSGNALDFASVYGKASGTIDGTNITCTNTVGTIIGGTVNNVDLTGQAVLWHFWAAASGSGNTNVTEESPLLGGSLMMAPALQTKS